MMGSDVIIDEIYLDRKNSEHLVYNKEVAGAIRPISMDENKAATGKMVRAYVILQNKTSYNQKVWVGINLKTRPVADKSNINDSRGDIAAGRLHGGVPPEKMLVVPPNGTKQADFAIKIPPTIKESLIYLRVSVWDMNPADIPSSWLCEQIEAHRLVDFPHSVLGEPEPVCTPYSNPVWFTVGWISERKDNTAHVDYWYDVGCSSASEEIVANAFSNAIQYARASKVNKRKLIDKAETIEKHLLAIQDGTRSNPEILLDYMKLDGNSIVNKAVFNSQAQFAAWNGTVVEAKRDALVPMRIRVQNRVNVVDTYKCEVDGYELETKVCPERKKVEWRCNIPADVSQPVKVKITSLMSQHTDDNVVILNLGTSGDAIVVKKVEPKLSVKPSVKFVYISAKQVYPPYPGSKLVLIANNDYPISSALKMNDETYDWDIIYKISYLSNGSVVLSQESDPIRVEKGKREVYPKAVFNIPDTDQPIDGMYLSVGGGPVGAPDSNPIWLVHNKNIVGTYEPSTAPGWVEVTSIAYGTETDPKEIPLYPNSTKKKLEMGLNRVIVATFDLKNTDMKHDLTVVCRAQVKYQNEVVADASNKATVGHGSDIPVELELPIPDVDGPFSIRCWVTHEHGGFWQGQETFRQDAIRITPADVPYSEGKTPYLQNVLLTTHKNSQIVFRKTEGIKATDMKEPLRYGDDGFSPLPWKITPTVVNPDNKHRDVEVWMKMKWIDERGANHTEENRIFADRLDPGETVDELYSDINFDKKYKEIGMQFYTLVDKSMLSGGLAPVMVETERTKMGMPVVVYKPEDTFVQVDNEDNSGENDPKDDTNIDLPDNEIPTEPNEPVPKEAWAIAEWYNIKGRENGVLVEAGKPLTFVLRVDNTGTADMTEDKCTVTVIVSSKNGEMFDGESPLLINAGDTVDVPFTWTPKVLDLVGEDEPLELFVQGIVQMTCNGTWEFYTNRGDPEHSSESFGFLVGEDDVVDIEELPVLDIEEFDLPAKIEKKVKERRFFILPDFGPLPELRVTATFPFPKIERLD